MRMLPIAVLVTWVVASSASAERTTTIQLGGMIGGVQELETDAPQMVVTGGPRITLAWEHPMPSLPPVRGYHVDATLVPELTGAALMNTDRGEVMLGVGARAELRVAQRAMGLWRVDARIAFYLAARALVIGDRKDTGFEGALGEYLYLGERRVRLGGEIGVIVRERASAQDHQVGVFAGAYLGWVL